jgi:hypothetical protein
MVLLEVGFVLRQAGGRQAGWWPAVVEQVEWSLVPIGGAWRCNQAGCCVLWQRLPGATLPWVA